MSIRKFFCAIIATTLTLCLAQTGSANTVYSNGFETDLSGWEVFGGSFNPTRVASGTNGITSADGSFHAQATTGTPATNWGGYNISSGPAPTAFVPYMTSVDIYLDLGAGMANDSQVEFTSAVNNAAGNHLRDFVFNGGFYADTDNDGPGAGTDRFIFSASNNAQGWPKNPGRNPIAISQSGWYTLQHSFSNDAGTLSVDMHILDDGGVSVGNWNLSTDPITNVTGNRYGWFATNELNVLAIDNAQLTVAVVPLPAAAWAGIVLIGGIGSLRKLRRA